MVLPSGESYMRELRCPSQQLNHVQGTLEFTTELSHNTAFNSPGRQQRQPLIFFERLPSAGHTFRFSFHCTFKVTPRGFGAPLFQPSLAPVVPLSDLKRNQWMIPYPTLDDHRLFLVGPPGSLKPGIRRLCRKGSNNQGLAPGYKIKLKLQDGTLKLPTRFCNTERHGSSDQ
ncbi:hypothetical protein GE21DRAFT_1291251 [Neurospora crassa]|nr:hypothetical protein GE21DRAFT_1291251 [Neurospora crassa]